eukprot:1524540-Rhodomonas_salina.2
MLSEWAPPSFVALKSTIVPLLVLVVLGVAASIALSMWQTKPSAKSAPKHTTYRHVNFGRQISERGDSSREGQTRRHMKLMKEGDTAVRVVDGILSPEECKKLISSAETDGFSRPEAFNESARSCERLHTVDVTLRWQPRCI